MQCDRAQEFFSDYLERTLDRPMTVALESHLASCSGCREEIEVLRDTFLVLDAVPAVATPTDGAWQVMCRIRQARAEQLEAHSQRPPSFVEWLRSLSPARAAVGAGLATFICAGALAMTPVPHTVLGILGRRSAAPPLTLGVVVDKPGIAVSYGPLTPEGQQVNIQVVPVIDMQDAYVQVTGANLPLNPAGQGDITLARPAILPFWLPAGSSTEVLRILVKSPSLRREYAYKAIVPASPGEPQNVTALVPGLPLESALRKLVPALGRPVLIDGEIDGNVTLQVENQAPIQTLDQVAEQVGARASQENGIYRLSPLK
jgi:hypothetical protein